MAAKNIIIRLQSTAGTGYHCTTTINTQNHPEYKKKLFKKFDPVVRKRVDFKVKDKKK